MDERTRAVATVEVAEIGRRVADLEVGAAPSRDEQRLRRANRALRCVAAIYGAQQHATEASSFLATVCRVTVEAGGFALAWIGLAERDPEPVVRPVAMFGRGTEYVPELHVRWDESPNGMGPTGRCVRTGAPVAAQRIATDPAFDPWREAANRHGLASTVALPLPVDGEVIGALVLYSTEADAFDGEDLDALVEVGHAVATGFAGLRDREERQRAEEKQRQAEQQARVAERRFRELADNVRDVFWELDAATGKVSYVSPAAKAVWDRDDELTDLAQLAESVHPEDAPRLAASFERARAGEATRTNYRIVRSDGTVRWIFDRAFPVRGDDGSLARIVGVAADVTEHKVAEQALQRLNADLEAHVRRRTQELEALYDQAPCGYHSVDGGGLVVRMNETELRWLGHPIEDVVGVRRFTDFVAADHRAALAAALAELASAPAMAEVELELLRADGSRFWVLLSAARDADTPGVTRMTAFDLTARRATEKAVREREEAVRHSRDELSAANAALERAALAKDEFLASMSHELRTPLNAILGLSEAFQDEIYGPVGDPQLRALKRIEESGRHLLSLINDILDLSKVEAGQLTLDRQPTSLDEVCRASLRLVQEAAHKKRIGVSYGIDDGLAILLADQRSLKQILVNLLSNAVKFTPEGGSIGLEVTTSAEEGTCTMSVWDTGIGIAAADQPRLFRPFVQLDSSLARHHAGTGLGLALVRRLVELHAGGIRVESTPDRGSRFTVVVPWEKASSVTLAPPSSRPPTPATSRGAPRTHVLLAEDDATNVALVADFFAAHDIDLTVARNGYEAITLAHEKVPDLILMDIQMPLLDGIAALRAIRQSATASVRRIPVIAVTALAMPGDRERCHDAGADDYLTKPLRLHKLLEAIEARVPPPHPPTRPPQ